ncbi:MAG: FMN-binding glutamate synthase family protein [Hyphomicrobiaceae bacterium]|nr:FMN-binding glutamate synthase family protein [Hyphomicrobiaceae bacterium]
MWLLSLPFQTRNAALTISFCATAGLAGLLWLVPGYAAVIAGPLALFAILSLVGLRDVFQSRHTILRTYPIVAHLRFLFESIRPEIRQYFFEGEKDGRPFSRDKRAIVYQRAKSELDKRPFGTQYDVYEDSFEWLSHSMAPTAAASEPFRIMVGGPDCSKPYSASVLNISGMSYGALSPNAIRALNKGARLGGFAHTTGEGSVSRYHVENGGDLIWQVASGYFGCRNRDGSFSPEAFAATAALDQVRMIELKLSQGAKPGHGGVLPAAKVNREISRARGVPMGQDCVSPARHSAFATPLEMMQFIGTLRQLSGGKPVGIKLCVGHPWEFLALVKAMLETGITPDFITVDGKEGGTGAAPLEFVDHIGMPLRDGLSLVHNALVGAALRDRIRIAASGKIISAFDMARAMAIGADWCNAARGFMFAVGCIQAQACHTDKCPVGVTSQDPARWRAINVPDKATRVARFHGATVKALAELVAAAGLDHCRDLVPELFYRRISHREFMTFGELYPSLGHGELLTGTQDPRFSRAWALARTDRFDVTPGPRL